MIHLDFDKTGGLIPAIAQDALSGEVLMLAWINREAWEATLRTGTAHYWSRSRNALWKIWECPGHTQEIVDILVDCDSDTVLYKVRQNGGAACHEGYSSCFFRHVKDDVLEVSGTKIKDPAEIYGHSGK